VTFWDTTFDITDWKLNMRAVIKGVFSRVTEIERKKLFVSTEKK
jgi:hypothetical protein|tara:strand:+ start:132 stop:263 length:132 start_codon:yes stop_codon:yes gene_type:complete